MYNDSGSGIVPACAADVTDPGAAAAVCRIRPALAASEASILYSYYKYKYLIEIGGTKKYEPLQVTNTSNCSVSPCILEYSVATEWRAMDL